MNYLLTDSKIVSDGNLTDCSFNIITCKNLVINNPPVVLESSSTETKTSSVIPTLELQNTDTTVGNMEMIAFLNSTEDEVATLTGVNVSNLTGEGNLILSVNNSSGNLCLNPIN